MSDIEEETNKGKDIMTLLISICAVAISLAAFFYTIYFNSRENTRNRLLHLQQICLQISEVQKLNSELICKIQDEIARGETKQAHCLEGIAKANNNKVLALLSTFDQIQNEIGDFITPGEYSIIATGYQALGIFNKAEEFYKKIADSEANFFIRAHAYRSLGSMLAELGTREHDMRALAYINEGIKLLENKEEKQSVALLLILKDMSLSISNKSKP